jgi:DNA-binding CsgD family transcriptional regulator
MHPAPRRKTPLHSAPKRSSALAPIALTTAFALTPRECEVLHWVCEGKRDREIATILCLSARTVQVHVGHILEKLKVETRTAAANYSNSIARSANSGSAGKRIRRVRAPKRPAKGANGLAGKGTANSRNAPR